MKNKKQINTINKRCKVPVIDICLYLHLMKLSRIKENDQLTVLEIVVISLAHVISLPENMGL